MYCSCLCCLLKEERQMGHGWPLKIKHMSMNPIFVNTKSVYLSVRDLHPAQPRLF